MTLEETFYFVGILYMGLMLILFVALVAAVLVIKAKINHIHQMIDQKVRVVSDITDAAKSIFKRKSK